MGTSSYIVKGLGNEKSYFSCSHGAGRKMGRKQACETLTAKACNKAMKGIVFDKWTKFNLSEAPLAYKDIDEVMESQKDLVEIVYKLTPLGVLKG